MIGKKTQKMSKSTTIKRIFGQCLGSVLMVVLFGGLVCLSPLFLFASNLQFDDFVLKVLPLLLALLAAGLYCLSKLAKDKITLLTLLGMLYGPSLAAMGYVWNQYDGLCGSSKNQSCSFWEYTSDFWGSGIVILIFMAWPLFCSLIAIGWQAGRKVQARHPEESQC